MSSSAHTFANQLKMHDRFATFTNSHKFKKNERKKKPKHTETKNNTFTH